MKNSIKIVHWVPRVMGIMAILFISLFALDAFGHGEPFWVQVGGFLMHLIPSFILAAILFLAWKKELIGGIIFTVLGLIMTPMVFSNNYAMNQSVGMSIGIIMAITMPFVIIGVLFIISYYMKKRVLSKKQDS
jgi:hypothetical protein